MSDKPVELYHPESYQSGCRVLHLRGRHKDGLAEERSILRVSYSHEQFREQYQSLIALMQPGERIYAAGGARNTTKAMRLFRERQLAAEFDGNPLDFYKNLESRWVSALMAPTSQGEKVWLFDCDEPVDVSLVAYELAAFYDRPQEPYWYETKSGHHCIVQPFDRNRLSDSVRGLIHENPYMLWAYSTTEIAP